MSQQNRATRRRQTRQGDDHRSSGPLIWIVVGVLVVVAAIVGLYASRPQQAATGATERVGEAAPQEVWRNLTEIPQDVWEKAPVVPATMPMDASSTGNGAPAANDGSKTRVTYVGAEYCPYCASERWALIAALSRFGTLTDIYLTTSSATDVFPNTPTFSFHRARYQSDYVDLQAVEVQGSQEVNGTYPPLGQPTAEQRALMQRFNPNGSIPFTVVGDRYVWVGSAISPEPFAGKTWEEIAAAIHSGQGDLAQQVLAAANTMSAAICSANGGRPEQVCGSQPVKAALAVLEQGR